MDEIKPTRITMNPSDINYRLTFYWENWYTIT